MRSWPSRVAWFRHALLGTVSTVLLSQGVEAGSGPTFLCPDGRGLCQWHSETGWQTLWRTSGGSPIDDFAAGAGYVFVLLRGHQEPGQLVILSDRYRTIGSIRFEHAPSLPSLVGWLGKEGAVVCISSPTSASCPLVLGSTGASTARPALEFPRDCLFPRVEENGVAACLARDPDGWHLWTRAGPMEPFQSAVSVERCRDCIDVDLGPSGGVMLVKVSGLAMVDETQVREVAIDSLDGVSWYRRRGSHRFVAFTAFDPNSDKKPRFVVASLGERELDVRAVWTSTEQTPRDIWLDGTSHVLVDAWGNGVRSLERCSLAGAAPACRRVWSERSKDRWQ